MSSLLSIKANTTPFVDMMKRRCILYLGRKELESIFEGMFSTTQLVV
jgi:hypothetical protein